MTPHPHGAYSLALIRSPPCDPVGQPLVSVVLPVFNAGPYIGAALQSICAQAYRRLEVIVVNDGSTDDTLAQIEKIAAGDARVKVVTRPNRGLIATLNEGLALAQGDLIARMDGDDIAYPERLSRQVEAFAAAPGLGLCATGVELLEMGRLWRFDPIAGGDLRILSQFFTAFIHPTVMFDRRVLGDVLHYDARYPHAEDFDLFRRIISVAPVKLIDAPLLAYRMHNNRVSMRHRELQQGSHLRIVAENLRANGFDLDAAALPALAAEKTHEAVVRVGAMLAALDTQISERPAPQRSSYEAGAVRLTHFLMHVLLDSGQARLLCELLTRTGKWTAIRRRERVILRLTSPAPVLASALMHISNSMQRLLELPTSRSASALARGAAAPHPDPAVSLDAKALA